MQQAWRAFGDTLPLLALWLLVATPVVAFLTGRRRRRWGGSWTAAALPVVVPAVAVGAGLVVLAVTLEPVGVIGTVSTTANWVPFATIADQVGGQVDASVAVPNLLFNVLLFVPVGFTWALVAAQLDRTMLKGAAAAAGLSVLVETAQLLLPLGRAVDVDDVLLNSVGALAGALIARLVARPLDRRLRQLRRPSKRQPMLEPESRS